MTCVALSGAGFFLRGVLLLQGSNWLESRWAQIAPHINDTVLLVAAVILCLLSGQYPFIQPWLTAKVLGLVAYILLGSLALTRRCNVPAWLRATGWCAALAVFAYMVSVAVTKDARGLFALL